MPKSDPIASAVLRLLASCPRDTRFALDHGLRRGIAGGSPRSVAGISDEVLVATRGRLCEFIDGCGGGRGDVDGPSDGVAGGDHDRGAAPLGPGRAVVECLVDASSDASAAEYVGLLAGVERALKDAPDTGQRWFLAVLLERLRAVDWIDPRAPAGPGLGKDSAALAEPRTEDDPLGWAAANLPAMTDAAAFRAVERLAGAGVPPQAVVPFLPRVAEALRTGVVGPEADPGERSALIAYGGLEGPLLAFAADAAELIPELFGSTLAWIGRDGALSGTHRLIPEPIAPGEIAAELHERRADRFAIVAAWLSPGPEVEIVVGCPTMRVDAVVRTPDGYGEPDGPQADEYIRQVMAARTGMPPEAFRSRPYHGPGATSGLRTDG